MHDWRAEWGYQALFSCCSSKKGGVAMLFNNNFSFQISKTYSDPGGRSIICDLITNGKILTLANTYAPNQDDPDFFNSFFNHLLDFSCEEITIGGDFSLVLDVGKDKKGGLATLRCGIAEKRRTLICISLNNKRITKQYICYMPRSFKL